ncbi:MAG: N-acetylneuraminate synthase family protein, partial [Desulfovermiculus sp.]
VLVHLSSTYPAPPEETNLLTIPHMRDLFGCEVGLSDHTQGIGAAIAATVLGATIIEKHFTLCRSDGGVDSAFSLEPEEMKTLVQETGRARQTLGRVRYGPAAEEERSRTFRRSLYVAQDLQPGEVLTRENIRCIRPGHGLAPRYLDVVVGKKLKKSAAKGTALTWDLLL